MARSLLSYLRAAIAKANENPFDGMGLFAMFNPDVANVVHPVLTWFGDLDTSQKNALVGNLAAIDHAMQHCLTTLPTAKKGAIRLIAGANNSKFGQEYCAQVRGLGWSNKIRPVYSIEVGRQHFGSPFAEKVATIFHELSHRACGTIDVIESGVTQYGTANCQALAAHSPSLALRNADNYGYFIASCTRSLAAGIEPS